MAWVCALNDASRRLTNPVFKNLILFQQKHIQENTEILFEEFGDHKDLKAMPKLSEIHVEKGPGEHLVRYTLSN